MSLICSGILLRMVPSLSLNIVTVLMWIYQQEASDAAWKAYKLKLVNIIRTSSTMSFY
jgi:hypothetical protein